MSRPLPWFVHNFLYFYLLDALPCNILIPTATMSPWQSHCLKGDIPNLEGSFHIDVPSDTDVWAKPPAHNKFDAPFIHKLLKLSKLTSVSITVTAQWAQLYDQGGIMVVVKSKSGENRWVKSGVELLDGVPRVGTVARDAWADWSLYPVVSKDGKSATVLFENKVGDSLWIYLIGDDGTKHPLREVTWWAELEADAELQVGVYGAKPSKGGDLRVEYRDFKVVSS